MFKKILDAIVKARMAEVRRMMAVYDDYRTFQHLSGLTDRQLNDIGIERHEIPRYIYRELFNDKENTYGNAA